MSDVKQDLNKIAAQYFELWQKQLNSSANEQNLETAIKLSQAYQEQVQEFLRTFDSPEKIQNWFNTYAESWKKQLNEKNIPFTFNMPFGTTPPAAAPAEPVPNVDELTQRIRELEEKLQKLESGSPSETPKPAKRTRKISS